MLERLPFYGQVLLFLGIALAIIGAAYFIWPDLSAKAETIESLNADYEEKKRRREELERIKNYQLPELQAKVERLREQLQDVQQILPTDKETGQFMMWIENVTDQSNLDLKAFDPRGLNKIEFYYEYPIEMQVVGRYHDLGVFFERVRAFEDRQRR
ncbi:MAG: type 4a pilus biogenesis protein PilO [Deltaproteobacteria bacterium]|nr:type 4a pilus biogenesis protein PilO [Deltaproteobacteria bacterium]